MKYQREEVPTSAHKRNWGSFWKLLSKGITLAASVSFHYATVGGDPPLAAVCGALGGPSPHAGWVPQEARPETENEFRQVSEGSALGSSSVGGKRAALLARRCLTVGAGDLSYSQGCSAALPSSLSWSRGPGLYAPMMTITGRRLPPPPRRGMLWVQLCPSKKMC